MSWLSWCPPAIRSPLPAERQPSADRGEVPLPAQNGLDRAMLPDRKNDDRHTVLPSKRECRGIHDFQVSVERLLMVETLVSLRIRIALGIGSIDAIDVGRLEHGVAPHFGGAQYGRGIGREV